MTKRQAFYEAFLELPCVIRIREIEGWIYQNQSLKDQIDRLKQTEKKMVQAQAYGQMDQYCRLKETYEQQKKEISDGLFVEEYVEALQVAHEILKNSCFIIEQKINEVLK